MARKRRFVICVRNDKYPAMLQAGKVYERFPDAFGESHELIRIIDEDDDSALYPRDCFLPLDVSKELAEALDSYGVLQPQH